MGLGSLSTEAEVFSFKHRQSSRSIQGNRPFPRLVVIEKSLLDFGLPVAPVRGGEEGERWMNRA